MKKWKDIVVENLKVTGYVLAFMGKNDHMFPIFNGNFTQCWYHAINMFKGWPVTLDGVKLQSIADVKNAESKSPKHVVAMLGKDIETGKNIIVSLEPSANIRNKNLDKASLEKNLVQFKKKNFGSFTNIYGESPLD